MKYTLILLLLTVVACQKAELQPTANPEILSRGYVEYNGYIQDLYCVPVDTSAYNAYNVAANRLTIHNDNFHIEVDSCFDVETDISRASGRFITPKGGGRFLFVPKT